ncbi:hypothetical protein LNTAR_20072 [Lentisphaera araneosa HTCC2155]|uniref:F5/8 type C domain-containing protein n=1 Tax=Lentisphaera araneosa HTCC2155 TaxID=313628 RepID=A6DPV9_9BACT|nr:discoidin domain-containing protein [Lentisphaera araneosa]EDM26404.1 hypothetical protein LNTAR_20072 [Lentisphaera araneosa HTCC2155]
MNFNSSLIYLLMALYLTSTLSAASLRPIKVTKVSASSVYQTNLAKNAVDNKITDQSRWLNAPTQEGDIWLQLEWDIIRSIQGIHLYSAYAGLDPVKGLTIEFRQENGEWVSVPSARIEANTSTALDIPFDTTIDVKTNALRIIITNTKGRIARVQEVVIWPASNEPMPPVKKITPPSELNGKVVIPKIYINQSGFNTTKPKRFTVPTLNDNTVFSIHSAEGGPALFNGLINKKIGDFSAFEPNDNHEYVIKAGDHTSVPFTIGLWQFERITYQNSIDFMVDSRHYVGNYKKACRGSFGWRDDHHFAWALRTLVPQYLSNPSAYDRMPKQIKYESSEIDFWGALKPYKNNAPDIVKLIHWGADVNVTQKTDHEFLKGELAFFLYAWPMLKQWLPQQNYDAVLAFVESTWAKEVANRKYPYDKSGNHNLFELKIKIGSAKGELPPGHSIMPNLLMYEVAKRDKLKNAEHYFDAAYQQVDWIVKNLDWENPVNTKGQRLSEHLTMTSLAAFLQLCPTKSPKGLKSKIQQWAKIMIRRSNNMWDFRKLTDDGIWTPNGEKRTMWNEVGNVVGFPAAVLAAEPFIEDSASKERLHELAWSHMDNSFGRNPVGRHFSYDAPREIEGVEHGWFSYYKGGIGMLANARFVFDGAPKHVHYPYHPEKGNYGWSEGWVNFNTAFNVSLAYMAKADSKIELTQKSNEITISLRAPLNFDITKNEAITLTVHGKTSKVVTLTEKSAESPYYIAKLKISDLALKPGDTLKVNYGFGYMETTASIKIK